MEGMDGIPGTCEPFVVLARSREEHATEGV